MPADPLLLKAGLWLGVATGLLLLATVVGFVAGWGTRFRLVGVTSFTGLLAISCLAFAISYSPRIQVAGAVSVPVVFDNGTDLVVAAAPADLPRRPTAPAWSRWPPTSRAAAAPVPMASCMCACGGRFRGAWPQPAGGAGRGHRGPPWRGCDGAALRRPWRAGGWWGRRPLGLAPLGLAQLGGIRLAGPRRNVGRRAV